ncbi:MAG TPA: hypothetical protein ENJ16_06530, partial [Planctomycetaceae bacterium]|nr:hypothetical protein [Planctomycetaceae bacterium]
MTATLENEIELEFQPHQFDAMWADAPYVCLATGLGGGKTWAGARWILTRAIEFPDSLHLVTINSLPQAQDVVVPELDRAVEDLGLEFRWESKRQRPNLYVYTGDRWAEVRVRSTWHPDSIRGPEYGSWWGDEVRDAGREGLLVAMGRLRCKKVDVPRYRWTTTTNGHDLIWERHKKEATLERTYTDERSGKDVRIWRGKNQKRLLVQAATDVNRFVHEDYTTLLEENYDPELARQERDAEFITLGNLVYYAFNFARNVSDSVRYDPAGGLIVALDFNVEPCVATIIQEVAGETWVVGEISMEGGGTSAVIAEFQRRFPGRIGNMAPVIYGDPSGTR